MPNRLFQNNSNTPNRKRKLDNIVATLEQASKNSKLEDSQFDKIRKDKCPWHPEDNHTTEQCWTLRHALKDTPEPQRPPCRGNGKKDNHDKDGDFQDPTHTVNVIFGGIPIKHSQKLLLWEIMSIELATPTFLKWSEVPITFVRANQWTSFSEPGRFPLVLDPVVAGSKHTKVLIDGGNGLNALFTKTLKRMGLDVSGMLTKTNSPFYGIISGNATVPLGQVVLPITFGTMENYRMKYIKFEVEDFETSYHAILGHPKLARFMAIPHYVYWCSRCLALKEYSHYKGT